MDNKKILILGGGIGGVVAANELRKRLPNNHKITVVDKNPIHSFAPSYLWLMVGNRKPEFITNSLKNLLHPKIKFVNADVNVILQNLNEVETSEGNINYDYLIIALGTDLAFDLIPGLSENAHTFYSYEGAIKLSKALQSFKKGRIAVVIHSLPFKCPAAPYEGAMLIANYFKEKGIRKDVEINLFTPEPLPMPVAGAELGNMVKKVIESKGIGFYPLHKMKSLDFNMKEISFDNNVSQKYDLLIVIPPHRSPNVIKNSGLIDDSGWITVNTSTLQTSNKNIYAMGDITSITVPGRWNPDVPMKLPKAGVFAHLQAEVVAKRISDEINGKIPKDIFCGDGFCMLEAGEGISGFAYGNFYGTPNPQVKLKKLGRIWHWGKVMFEKWWLSSYGIKKAVLKSLINLVSKIMGVPIKL